jgi:glycosyltransferase involved in cell wall biosynthesis
MRIALITDPYLINSNYRAYQPMHILSARGHAIGHNGSREQRFHLPRLMNSDVVLIHRYSDDETRAVLRQLRSAGVGVVWDNDDDLAAVPRSNPLYRQYGGPNRRHVVVSTTETVQLADVVTSPSSGLIEQFRGLGAANTHVLENYVRNDFIVRNAARSDRIVVGWLAGLEHQLDYQSLRLRDSLERLLALHPDLHLVSIGIGLGLHSDRYVHTKRVTFLDLPRHLAEFDIGIAPLADIPFNQARSNVKLKEYAAAGVPWLASPVGAYRGMGEKQGGLLVADDRWFEELERLIDNARDRRKLAKRAAKWGKTQTIGNHADKWEAVLGEAVERAQARVRGSGTPAGSRRVAASTA